jgi:hypothetical protein
MKVEMRDEGGDGDGDEAMETEMGWGGDAVPWEVNKCDVVLYLDCVIDHWS